MDRGKVRRIRKKIRDIETETDKLTGSGTGSRRTSEPKNLELTPDCIKQKPNAEDTNEDDDSDQTRGEAQSHHITASQRHHQCRRFGARKREKMREAIMGGKNEKEKNSFNEEKKSRKEMRRELRRMNFERPAGREKKKKRGREKEIKIKDDYCEGRRG